MLRGGNKNISHGRDGSMNYNQGGQEALESYGRRQQEWEELSKRMVSKDDEMRARFEKIQKEYEKFAELSGYCERCWDTERCFPGLGCQKCSLDKVRRGTILLTGRHQYCKKVQSHHISSGNGSCSGSLIRSNESPEDFTRKAKMQTAFEKLLAEREGNENEKFERLETNMKLNTTGGSNKIKLSNIHKMWWV